MDDTSFEGVADCSGCYIDKGMALFAIEEVLDGYAVGGPFTDSDDYSCHWVYDNEAVIVGEVKLNWSHGQHGIWVLCRLFSK
jgi:hypothetical protein